MADAEPAEPLPSAQHTHVITLWPDHRIHPAAHEQSDPVWIAVVYRRGQHAEPPVARFNFHAPLQSPADARFAFECFLSGWTQVGAGAYVGSVRLPVWQLLAVEADVPSYPIPTQEEA